MPIWNIAAVEDRPTVTLRSWGVREVPLYGSDQPWTRHFVGYCLEDCQGQVSSPVLAFDAGQSAGCTRSGRLYRLLGSPGHDPDALYTWERWKAVYGIVVERDVTEEIAAAIESARSGDAPGTRTEHLE